MDHSGKRRVVFDAEDRGAGFAQALVLERDAKFDQYTLVSQVSIVTSRQNRQMDAETASIGCGETIA